MPVAAPTRLADGLRWLIHLLMLCIPLQGMAAGMQRIDAASHVHPTASAVTADRHAAGPIRTLIDPRRSHAGHGARRHGHAPVFVHASSLGAAPHAHGSVVHRHAADDASLVQLVDTPADPAPAVNLKRVASDVDTPPLTTALDLGGRAARVAVPAPEHPPVPPDPHRLERPPRNG